MDLEKLREDLLKFKLDVPIVVNYLKESNELILSQIGLSVNIPYIKNYYFPLGSRTTLLLTPMGLSNLLDNINNILSDSQYHKNELVIVPDKLKIKFYKSFNNPNLIGPQLVYELKFWSIKSKLLMNIFLRYFSLESKLMLKLIK